MLNRCPYLAIDDPDPAHRVELNLHIGLGAGCFTSMQVGGVFDSWEYLLAGPPLSQIAISEPAALSGQAVASPGQHLKCLCEREWVCACVSVSAKE